MSKALAKAGGPEHFLALEMVEAGGIAELIAENIGVSGLTLFDFPRVDIPAGGSTLWQIDTPEGPTGVNALEGIILMAQDHRVYYRSSYGGGNEVPDCASADALIGIGDPGGLCQNCPNAKWGSALRQDGTKGRGQACSLRKQLVFLRPDEYFPMLIDLPPSSLGGLKQYMVSLTGRGMKYYQVITSIYLSSVRNDAGISYSKAEFRMIGPLEAEVAAKAAEYSAAIRSVVQIMDLEAETNKSMCALPREEFGSAPATNVTIAEGEGPFGDW